MINTSEVQQRLRRVYKMMLKFFGVKLMGEYGEDTEVIEVERAENFASRFENLTTNPHNNLRITRILLSLGELGAEEYQAPLVRFFLKEILIKNKLPRMKKSVNFFIPAVRDSQERQDLLFFAWRYYFPKEEFIWGNHGELARYKAKPVVAALLPAPLSEWTPIRRTRRIWRGRMVPVEEWTNSSTSNIGVANGYAANVRPFATVPGKHLLSQVPVKDLLSQVPVKDLLSQVPVKDLLSQVPVKDLLSQVPVKDLLSQVPVKDLLSQVPVKDLLSQVPVKDLLSQVPVKDLLSQVPVKDLLSQVPVTDLLSQVPVTDLLSQVPVKDLLSQVPVKDLLSQVPTPKADPKIQDPHTCTKGSGDQINYQDIHPIA
uniref:Opioid growth factor receptor (OGFr) conserved domain-containing protein n=1 Tax=Leptobrachium leishanense TaxID=445787 RepID=A0A8C5PPI0_9ANUR